MIEKLRIVGTAAEDLLVELGRGGRPVLVKKLHEGIVQGRPAFNLASTYKALYQLSDAGLVELVTAPTPGEGIKRLLAANDRLQGRAGSVQVVDPAERHSYRLTAAGRLVVMYLARRPKAEDKKRFLIDLVHNVRAQLVGHAG